VQLEEVLQGYSSLLHDVTQDRDRFPRRLESNDSGGLKMAQMTDEDYYEIKVYPKGRRVVLRFVGDCWDVYNYEMTYNSYVASIRKALLERLAWRGAIGSELTHGYYVWTWEQKVLDIKGDG
jgi:hypothetical protein